MIKTTTSSKHMKDLHFTDFHFRHQIAFRNKDSEILTISLTLDDEGRNIADTYTAIWVYNHPVNGWSTRGHGPAILKSLKDVEIFFSEAWRDDTYRML